MPTGQSIPPFPPDLDRNYFGAWLSGFTDGEGCFRLAYRHEHRPRPTPEVRFSLQLRADEEAIVRLVHSYWQCGTVSFCVPNRGKEKRVVRLHVNDFTSLAEVVVPHFERYPLCAKKARDFAIWKQGVALASSVAARPLKCRGKGGGFDRKWTDQEIAAFLVLHDALKRQREYSAPTITPPPPPGEPTLFDRLP